MERLGAEDKHFVLVAGQVVEALDEAVQISLPAPRPLPNISRGSFSNAATSKLDRIGISLRADIRSDLQQVHAQRDPRHYEGRLGRAASLKQHQLQASHLRNKSQRQARAPPPLYQP